MIDASNIDDYVAVKLDGLLYVRSETAIQILKLLSGGVAFQLEQHYGSKYQDMAKYPGQSYPELPKPPVNITVAPADRTRIFIGLQNQGLLDG